ncbi:hypothetical protein N7G274_009733 [Stereocaulon virgatum]|uniref:CENP-V/GFA domain-containing protein n=1 Tax=Stereocaulon virgatum TaxID=373712 RepID=A0ABR3ZVV7_9LECA
MAQIEWPSKISYAEYESSPSGFRGFCDHCCSTLVWRSEKDPEEVGFTTGTLDEDVLIGKREACDGLHQGREGTETGKQLASIMGGHLWMGNAMGGGKGLGKRVTDEVEAGKR